MSHRLCFGDDHEAAMQYAIACAERGLGHVEPNPPVGAILLDVSGNLVAEGWHRKFGGPHAEVECLKAFRAAAQDTELPVLGTLTMFVTLEPCCHTGKTGPCSRALIDARLGHVVVATEDPSPHVNGGGIEELREAGIRVEVGVARSHAQHLIRAFVHSGQTKRPWVHAKWAMTLDGRIATRTGSSQWISNEESRAVVHELRGRMDAILVGAGTAQTDNPTLTARPVGPRIATRIVLDSQAALPENCNLIQTVDQAPVLLVCSADADEQRVQKLESRGVEVLRLPKAASTGRLDIGLLLDELGNRSMTNLLVEGGGQLLGAMSDAGLIDEVHAFIAPKLIGGSTAVSPIGGIGSETVAGGSSLSNVETSQIGDDIYINGVVQK